MQNHEEPIGVVPAPRWKDLSPEERRERLHKVIIPQFLMGAAGALLFVLGVLVGMVVAALIALNALTDLTVALIGNWSCDAECLDQAARLWLQAREEAGVK